MTITAAIAVPAIAGTASSKAVCPGGAWGQRRGQWSVCISEAGNIWKYLLMSSHPVSKRSTQLPNSLSGHHRHSHRRTRSSASLQRLGDGRGCLQTLPPIGTLCLGLPQGQDPSLHFSCVPQTKIKCPVFLGQSKASAQCQCAPGGPGCRSCSCPWLEPHFSCYLVPVALADLRPTPTQLTQSYGSLLTSVNAAPTR